jgi:hypothetical protein
MDHDAEFVKGGRRFRTTIHPCPRMERNAISAAHAQNMRKTLRRSPFRDNWEPIIRSPVKICAASLARYPALSCASAWCARVAILADVPASLLEIMVEYARF